MSLIMIIVCVTVAGITMMIGTVLTFRRSHSTQQDDIWVSDAVRNTTIAQCPSTAQCAYCGGMTVHYIGVMHDGHTYSPVCLDCQYRTGIRCQDGSISQEFVYQVQQYC